jgi:hypothetical protein
LSQSNVHFLTMHEYHSAKRRLVSSQYSRTIRNSTVVPKNKGQYLYNIYYLGHMTHVFFLLFIILRARRCIYLRGRGGHREQNLLHKKNLKSWRPCFSVSVQTLSHTACHHGLCLILYILYIHVVEQIISISAYSARTMDSTTTTVSFSVARRSQVPPRGNFCSSSTIYLFGTRGGASPYMTKG